MGEKCKASHNSNNCKWWHSKPLPHQDQTRLSIYSHLFTKSLRKRFELNSANWIWARRANNWTSSAKKPTTTTTTNKLVRQNDFHTLSTPFHIWRQMICQPTQWWIRFRSERFKLKNWWIDRNFRVHPLCRCRRTASSFHALPRNRTVRPEINRIRRCGQPAGRAGVHV